MIGDEEGRGDDDENGTLGGVRVGPKMVNIAHRVRPIIPPPNPEVDDTDADGFSLIGRVGAWDCLLS